MNHLCYVGLGGTGSRRPFTDMGCLSQSTVGMNLLCRCIPRSTSYRLSATAQLEVYVWHPICTVAFMTISIDSSEVDFLECTVTVRHCRISSNRQL